MTSATAYMPALGIVRGHHADDDATRAALILRWGDQIAESRFDGVTLCERDGERWTLVTRSEWDDGRRVWVPRTRRG